MKKQLILKGCAGLGNRIITVCYAIHYSKKTNRDLFIDWTDGQFAPRGINAFNLYFETEGVPVINQIDLIKTNTLFPEDWRGHLNAGVYDHYEVFESQKKKSLLAVFKTEKSKMQTRCWITKNSPEKKCVFPFGSDLSFNKNEDAVIFADFLPEFKTEIFRENFRLKKNIKQEVDEYSKEHKLSKNVIGVHVRSTDKKPGKDLAALFRKIDALKKNETRLFLCTDNIFIENEIKTRYSNTMSYPKFLPENPTEGLHQHAAYHQKEHLKEQLFKESIMDMWLLSQCEFLLYQGNSSFSRISRQLHKDDSKTFDWLN